MGVVDAKEYFEFATGTIRAFTDPMHWDSLTFLYKRVLEGTFGVGFLWGEVIEIDGVTKCARVKTMISDAEEEVFFDYCIIATGSKCADINAPWQPKVNARERNEVDLQHLDERYLEGRRRHIIEECQELVRLNQNEGTVVVIGASFNGIEWACELKHAFPELQIVLTDFLPRCLGKFPEKAAKYCEDYMQKVGIRTVYEVWYQQNSNALPQKFWDDLSLPNKADRVYVTVTGIKHCNHYMPPETLSPKGPGGGGWILMNKYLQVMQNETEWSEGCIFAVGDCNLACVGQDNASIPKTGYPAEEQAVHACRNIISLDRRLHGGHGWCCCLPLPVCCNLGLRPSWHPWGASIFAISLGPSDGVVVIKGVGCYFTGLKAAALKELIETTKLAQGRGDHRLSTFLWYLIHHWPVNFWGRGVPWITV